VDQQDEIAVIGAGVIGCATAWALSREGRSVLLIDPDEPGLAGASFGNVGHIAAELVEPLPSPRLLFGFWRQLYALGGALDLPLARLPQLVPWSARFAAAAFRRRANTRRLAPLVKPAAQAWSELLAEVGESRLLRRNGHYQIWHGRSARARAAAEASHMEALGVTTQPATAEIVRKLAESCGDVTTSALRFPDSAHVTDPRAACEVLARAAAQRGAHLVRGRVRQLTVRGDRIEVTTEHNSVGVKAAVVCAGVWSAPLLAGFGLHCPIASVRGYHVELPGHEAIVDAPLVYTEESLVVTPMAGRLRASSYMEFTAPEAPADAGKAARLRAMLARLGYRCPATGASWVGPRPVLPDYLPGIGRVPGTRVFYALGHQHIGLTLAPVTAQLIAALVAGRRPSHDVAAFDLQRFN